MGKVLGKERKLRICVKSYVSAPLKIPGNFVREPTQAQKERMKRRMQKAKGTVSRSALELLLDECQRPETPSQKTWYERILLCPHEYAVLAAAYLGMVSAQAPVSELKTTYLDRFVAKAHTQGVSMETLEKFRRIIERHAASGLVSEVRMSVRGYCERFIRSDKREDLGKYLLARVTDDRYRPLIGLAHDICRDMNCTRGETRTQNVPADEDRGGEEAPRDRKLLYETKPRWEKRERYINDHGRFRRAG